MNKKYVIVSLIIVTVLGSLFNVLGQNMLFDDIFNVGVKLDSMTVVASLPAVSIAVFFVLLTLYIIRIYKHPGCVKRITRLYLIITIVLGLIGFVGAVLAGTNIYHTFVGRHPFPGYLIIFMIMDILLVCGSSLSLMFLRRVKADEERVKVNFKYVMKTIGWFLFICLTFNRFGMLLGAPTYIYLRNLYQTFPFYLYLLMPLFLGVMEVLYILGILERKVAFRIGIISIGVNIFFFAYIAIMGINDTSFISSLSQAMPLERMASKPVELPIHFLSYTGVAIALMVQNRKPKEDK